MNENSRCSILFHLLVPGGKWQTEITSPLSVLKFWSSVFHSLTRAPLLPPLSVGFVSFIGVLLIAPISSWTAPFGARLAHRLPKRYLEMAFGIFLLLVAVRFLVSLVASI